MLQYHVEPDSKQFRRVAAAIDDESDGRELRADLTHTFEDLLDGIVAEQRSGLMAMASGGLPHEGEPLRNAISERIAVDIRFSGRSAGARIKVRKSGMPRRFVNAAKRTNDAQWRRRVFGGAWVVQLSGAQDWFDDPIKRLGPKAHRAAGRAVDRVAQRIDRKT